MMTGKIHIVIETVSVTDATTGLAETEIVIARGIEKNLVIDIADIVPGLEVQPVHTRSTEIVLVHQLIHLPGRGEGDS